MMLLSPPPGRLSFDLPIPVMPPKMHARPAGRPPLAIPRADKIRAVTLLMSRALLGKQAAGAWDVGRTTVYRWRAELLADGQSDTDHLRRLAASRN